MTTPPLEYLLGCSDSSLREFMMRRLERAAILKKEKKEVLEELVAALVEAETARILLDSRRLSTTGHPIQKSLDLVGDACREVAAEFGAPDGIRRHAAD